jgi:hypothetical protein
LFFVFQKTTCGLGETDYDKKTYKNIVPARDCHPLLVPGEKDAQSPPQGKIINF